ncbi:MAG: hypothetical protein OXG33_06455 [Chloroflexi bacterium]|nr:hypothetical protein [Chloroflexota bacterium]
MRALRAIAPWIVATGALLILLTVERHWPAFPEFDGNLEFGPFQPGDSLSQTVKAPRTPLRAVMVYPIGTPPPGTQLRVFAIDDEPALIAESIAAIDPEGRLRWEIPQPVDTSGRWLRLQIVNSPESRQTLTVEANFSDPYRDGEAAAHGDVAMAGQLDVRIAGWRSMRIWDVAVEVWQATALGAGIAVLTGLVAVGALRAWLRSLALAVAIAAVGLCSGYWALAPWPG